MCLITVGLSDKLQGIHLNCKEHYSLFIWNSNVTDVLHFYLLNLATLNISDISNPTEGIT